MHAELAIPRELNGEGYVDHNLVHLVLHVKAAPPGDVADLCDDTAQAARERHLDTISLQHALEEAREAYKTLDSAKDGDAMLRHMLLLC
jgi:hypothetical protein